MSLSSAPHDASVRFATRLAGNGQRVAIATLDSPTTLNGLSLEMAKALHTQLQAWADDDDIAVVVLEGAGEKAFCAGGDLQGLYRSMRDWQEAGSGDILANAYARDFFQIEYRLDYRIYTFPKPLLCWGHGIVMGGGIGLMAGARHRVVSERSRLAFPEITVGLFPDVAGSWLLPRVPRSAGLFLALTGAPLSAGDAIYAGLADHYVAEDRRSVAFDKLCAESWSTDVEENNRRLSTLLRGLAMSPPTGPLQKHAQRIESICTQDSLQATVAAIAAIDDEDPWLKNARDTLHTGAPGSARLAYELQRRSSDLSLAEVFAMECVVALHCAAHGDFAEGIRALLIDKDRQPRWQPSTLDAATREWADPFFKSPWTRQSHPLADLGCRVEVSA